MAIKKTKPADISSNYKKYIEISLILSLMIIVAAFTFSPKSSKPKPIKEDATDKIIKVTEIVSTKQNQSVQNKLRPIVPEIIIDENPDDISFLETIIDENITISKMPDQKPTDRITEPDPKIFEFAEVMPGLINGIKSIQEKIYYTDLAIRAEIEGKVLIEAILDEKGNVMEATILRGIFGQLDEIALNAVKETKFIPAMQRGKPVKIKIVIPIKFQLKR